jgi:hypothetical protein
MRGALEFTDYRISEPACKRQISNLITNSQIQFENS